MPFVSFTTEAYRNKLPAADLLPAGLLSGAADALLRRSQLGPGAYRSPAVRRPLEGLTIKERTPANLSVLRHNGEPIMLNNMLGANSDGDYAWLGEYAGAPAVSPVSGALQGAHYTDFSILQLQESREERVQVVETFGENFVFFFGERPRFLSVGGVLVNSKNFPWRSLWWDNYDRYLRGTKCVESRARVYLAWDDVVVEGYIVSASATDSSAEPHQIPFNFSMLLTKHTSIGLSGDEITADAIATFPSRRAEILGSLDADVRNNGQPVDIDAPFFLEQLAARLGLSSVTEAFEAARTYGIDVVQLAERVPAVGNTISNAHRLLNGLSVYGAAAPLMSLWDGMASSSESGERSVEGIPVDTLAGRDAARRIFGSDMKSMYSLDVI